MSTGRGGGGWGQGGGGFGQPPGGGGFGQPPGAPAGGGGFGFPPGGGGGFGPPGGHGPGGFGHGPPGEQPLARIPFSGEDEANLMSAARIAKIAGVVSVVSALMNAFGGLLHGGGRVLGGLVGGTVGVAIALALCALLWRAAGALEKVATTDGADQHHLVAALRELRTYFMVRGILYLALTLLFCCCGALLFATGAALLGTLPTN